MNNRGRLEAIFIKILRLPEAITRAELEALTWESSKHLFLVFEIEKAYKFRLSSKEIFSMKSFARAIEIVKAHGFDD